MDDGGSTLGIYLPIRAGAAETRLLRAPSSKRLLFQQEELAVKRYSTLSTETPSFVSVRAHKGWCTPSSPSLLRRATKHVAVRCRGGHTIAREAEVRTPRSAASAFGMTSHQSREQRKGGATRGESSAVWSAGKQPSRWMAPQRCHASTRKIL